MKEGILESLFGATRLRIIRLFFMNPDSFFTVNEISRRAKASMPVAKREILFLKNIGFIAQIEEKIEEIVKLKNGKIKNNKKKAQGLKLNLLFPFLRSLKNLVIDTMPLDREKMAKTLNSTGKIKLVVLSGIFTLDNSEKNADLLIVGDSIRRVAMERALKKIEAEIGIELKYAVFSTKEFLYRFGMYDKFLFDILDFQHEKIIDKLNL